MALANFIKSGTYSTVEEINYSREYPRIIFNLCVWSDSSKNNLLLSVPFCLDGSVEKYTIAQTFAAPDSGTELDVDALVLAGVPSIITNANSDYLDHIFVDKNENSDDPADFGTLVPYEGLLIYRSDLSKYFKYKDGTGFVEMEADFFCSDHFDTYFGLSVQSQIDFNLSRCIYEYLKTRTDFVGVIDA